MTLKTTTMSWDKALDDFEEHLVPFLAHGYSRDTALMALMLNRIYTELLDIEESLLEDVPEDEEPDQPRWL